MFVCIVCIGTCTTFCIGIMGWTAAGGVAWVITGGTIGSDTGFWIVCFLMGEVYLVVNRVLFSVFKACTSFCNFFMSALCL
jgi:hypothetical protein